MRPDHVPTLAGEPNNRPGYETLGRLFAIGYIRGLEQSAYGHPATRDGPSGDERRTDVSAGQRRRVATRRVRRRTDLGPRGDAVHWVDIIQGEMLVTDFASGATRVTAYPEMVGAVAPRVGGGSSPRWRAASSAWMPTAPSTGAPTSCRTGIRMNDAKTDPAGRFWAGSCEMGFAEGLGGLWRLDENWEAMLVLPELTLPNGLGWSPDGRASTSSRRRLARSSASTSIRSRARSPRRRPSWWTRTCSPGASRTVSPSTRGATSGSPSTGARPCTSSHLRATDCEPWPSHDADDLVQLRRPGIDELWVTSAASADRRRATMPRPARSSASRDSARSAFPLRPFRADVPITLISDALEATITPERAPTSCRSSTAQRGHPCSRNRPPASWRARDPRRTPWPGGCAGTPADGSCSCPTPGPSVSTTVRAGVPRRGRRSRRGTCCPRTRPPASWRRTSSPHRCGSGGLIALVRRHADDHGRDRESLPRAGARRASCSIRRSARRSSTTRATSSPLPRRSSRMPMLRAASPTRTHRQAGRRCFRRDRSPTASAFPAWAPARRCSPRSPASPQRGHVLQPDAGTRRPSRVGWQRPSARLALDRGECRARMAMVPAPLRGRGRAGQCAPRRGGNTCSPRGGAGTRIGAGEAITLSTSLTRLALASD